MEINYLSNMFLYINVNTINGVIYQVALLNLNIKGFL